MFLDFLISAALISLESIPLSLRKMAKRSLENRDDTFSILPQTKITPKKCLILLLSLSNNYVVYFKDLNENTFDLIAMDS